jgi:hypothetical protein
MSAQVTPHQVAEGLSAVITYDLPDAKRRFDIAFNKFKADVNYSDAEVDPPLIDAIMYCNEWARKELLKRGADVKKLCNAKLSALHVAVNRGDEDAVRDLLDHGANPHVFCSANLLNYALLSIRELDLLQNADINTDDPRKCGHSKELARELSDFFFQRGEYAISKDAKAKPFSKKGPFHAYYRGKIDILGMLLNEGVSPSTPASGSDRSAKNIVRNPMKYADKFHPGGGSLQFIEYEGDSILKLHFKFANKSNHVTEPIEFIVHYDMRFARDAIEAHIASHPDTEGHIEDLARQMDSKMRDQFEEQQLKVRSAVHSAVSGLDGDVKDLKERAAKHTAAQMVLQHQTYQLAMDAKDSKELAAAGVRMGMEAKAKAEDALRVGTDAKTLADQSAVVLAAHQQVLGPKVEIGLRRAELTKRTRNNPHVEEFCSTLETYFRSKLFSNVVIASDDVKRSGKKAMDIASGAVQAISGLIAIPILSKFVEVGVGGGLQVLSDAREVRKGEKVNETANKTKLDLEDCGRAYALALTEPHAGMLVDFTVPGKAKELALKAGEEVMDAARNKKFDKIDAKEYQDAFAQMAAVVNQSESYKKKFQAVWSSQKKSAPTYAPAYEAAAETVATGPSVVQVRAAASAVAAAAMGKPAESRPIATGPAISSSLPLAASAMSSMAPPMASAPKPAMPQAAAMSHTAMRVPATMGTGTPSGYAPAPALYAPGYVGQQRAPLMMPKTAAGIAKTLMVPVA